MRPRHALGASLLWSACVALPAAARYESPALPAGGIAAVSRAAVILDPGHGGEDLGAVVAGRREKDIALAIAQRVKGKLEALAASPVKLTRDSDIFIPLDRRVGETLETEHLAFISLHVNQVRSRRQRGIRIYAFGQNQFKSRRRPSRRKVAPLPPPPVHEARAGNALAASLVRSLRAQGFPVDPPAKAAFYVLKNPNTPSVLIELGYLSNPQEAKLLNDPAYQDRLAEAIAVSLESHFAASAPAEPSPEDVAAPVLASERLATSAAESR